VSFKQFETAGWSEAGRADAYDRVVGRVTARVIEPLLDAAGVGSGTRLLDVATGPGHVAAAAAARGAAAVGLDISEEMLARARLLYPRVDFRRADAERLPFEEGAFDAAVAAFLLHHVPSPERVVGELARVARRVAVAQWDVSSRARLLGLITDAIAATGVEPPADRPVGPSRERLAADEELRRLLEGAGLVDVELSTVAFEQRLSGTDELWEGVLGGSVNTRAIVLAQPLATQERIRTELERLAEPHRREGGIDVPVSVRIASADRPPVVTVPRRKGPKP
jgi:ubiquinone/menaquinone biosynthesis C-methylase UbiE